MIGMEEQQQNLMKERQRTNAIRQLSIDNGYTLKEQQLMSRLKRYNIGSDDSEVSFNTAGTPSDVMTLWEDNRSVGTLPFDDYWDHIDREIEKDMQNQEARKLKVQKHLDDHLVSVSQQGDSSIIQKVITLFDRSIPLWDRSIPLSDKDRSASSSSEIPTGLETSTQMPASSSSEIPSGLGTSTQMPGYLSGTPS